MSRTAAWRASALAPFKSRIFAAVWTASLISNLGSLIQAVGASWLMASIAPSPDMVALVQASTALPIMLMSLPAGAIADTHDSRRVMLVAQSFMLTVSIALAVTAYLGLITPWILLLLTFLLGCGAALYGPAWQCSVAEQVPRADVPAAVYLSSLAFNIARTSGPAIGGVIVAALGAAAAFVANAMSYIGLIAVLIGWKRKVLRPVLPPESMGMAMLAGLRYVHLSPAIRAVLVRGFVFGLLGSAIWALMPLIARDLLQGTALTYGLLFGAFGVGAVGGALLASSMGERVSSESLVRISSVVFGAMAVAVALSTWLALSMVILLIGGAAWVTALSILAITVQISAPRWVVGRAVAIYQMVTFGGLAGGAWLFGELAKSFSLQTSIIAAGTVMVLSAVLGLKFKLPPVIALNLDPLRSKPEPDVAAEVVPQSGPVVVTIEYVISPEDRDAFMIAMRELRRIRRRDGARQWVLLHDIDDPFSWTERFQSPTWLDYLRQRQRLTVADRDATMLAFAFHRGETPPKVRHALERTPTVSSSQKTEAQKIRERASMIDPNLPPAPMPAAHTKST